MQSIEFEAQLNNGVIQLPAAFHYWHEGRKVKVIVLDDDIETNNLPLEQHTINNQSEKPALSCLDLIKDDIGVIDNAPSDLSTNPAYLTGYGA